jgi:hypothetical protein
MDSLLFIALAAFVAAVGLYYLDIKKGKSLYRSWYNLTHEKPMEGSLTRGFIHQSSLRNKIIIAVILAFMQLVVSFFVGSFHLIHDPITSLFICIGLVVGFVTAAPVLDKAPKSIEAAKKILDTADSMEEKYLKKNPVNQAEPIAKTENKLEEKAPEEKAKETKVDEEQDKPKDWRSGVKDYLKK